MGAIDLLVLYVIAGTLCACVVWVRRRSVFSTLVTLIAWPLWAPFVLMEDKPARTREELRADPEHEETRCRIHDRLSHAEEVASTTDFSSMLNRESVARIRKEVDAAADRLTEIDRVLAVATAQYDTMAKQATRLGATAINGTVTRSLQLQLASIERLRKLRDRQATCLLELEPVLIALCGQLAVARYTDASGDGVSTVVGELWGRVEGLGVFLETTHDLDADKHAASGSALQLGDAEKGLL